MQDPLQRPRDCKLANHVSILPQLYNIASYVILMVSLQDVMYIFMEYCGDGTISDVSKVGLPEAMIRKYTDQILIAVEFLHDKGIVHRDIKG